jgi:hypothetical protein
MQTPEPPETQLRYVIMEGDSLSKDNLPPPPASTCAIIIPFKVNTGLVIFNLLVYDFIQILLLNINIVP